MPDNAKPVELITISDLQEFPVWEFDIENEGQPDRDETWMIPVTELPVSDLSNRLVGTQAQLSSGEFVSCILGNIDLNNRQKTEQFLCLTVLKDDGNQFFLARYFDSDYDQQGPEALASFLGMSVDEIFPITYDISASAAGLESVTSDKGADL